MSVCECYTTSSINVTLFFCWLWMRVGDLIPWVGTRERWSKKKDDIKCISCGHVQKKCV